MPSQFQVIAGTATALAAIAAVAWFLLKDDGEDEETKQSLTKDDVIKILKEIIDSQKSLKESLKAVTDDVTKQQLNLEQVYARVKESEPEEPLTKHGLSMAAFDALLEKHQQDGEVRQLIFELMSQQEPLAKDEQDVLTVVQLVEVHEFMCAELEKVAKEFQNFTTKEGVIARTVIIAAQAIVQARVQQRFQYTSERVEMSVFKQQEELGKSAEFRAVSEKMQRCMQSLLDEDMAAAAAAGMK